MLQLSVTFDLLSRHWESTGRPSLSCRRCFRELVRHQDGLLPSVVSSAHLAPSLPLCERPLSLLSRQEVGACVYTHKPSVTNETLSLCPAPSHTSGFDFRNSNGNSPLHVISYQSHRYPHPSDSCFKESENDLLTGPCAFSGPPSDPRSPHQG